MKRIVSAGACIFLIAASLWPIAPVQACHPATQPPGTVETSAASDDPRTSTPSELRSRVLYGGTYRASELRNRLLYGAGEFYTFQHSLANGARRGETPVRKPPFDPQTEDRWVAFDKVQHLTFSFLWTLGTQYIVVNKGRISEQHALPLSISSSAVAGLSKEVYDLRIGPTQYFSTKDLVADALGILLATGVILL